MAMTSAVGQSAFKLIYRRNPLKLWSRIPRQSACGQAMAFGTSAESPKMTRQRMKNIRADVLACVNGQIASKDHGRLFAVIQIDSTQFKVTDGDIVVVEGVKRFDIGDKIRLEKVLCVGCKDFTLFGRPLVPRDLIHVEATVIEKTLDETKVEYDNVQRVALHTLQFFRNPISLLRINRIEMIGSVGNTK